MENHIRQIQKLYQRHADEFSTTMTGLVKLQTAGGAQDVRVFSLRGAHLLGFFAETERAKDFRRWVLDILDGQAADANTVVSEYQRAIALLRAEQEVASWAGHRLNAWKAKKSPMESNAARLFNELQLCLPLTYH